ncbi:MAG: response regulator [Planctomycetes bacterium]|nr:response regulator [Planctomycetota bacterium]
MSSALSPARILVAEDIATMGLLVQRLLRERGHSVRFVSNGLQALDRLRAEPFDLVVTDWVMPEMDGIELILRTRHEFGAASPPFVIQTAVDTADAKEAVLEAGADEFLAKPWPHDEFVATVERCLARSRAPRIAPVAEPVKPVLRTAPFRCVCLAASTGGPVTMRDVLQDLAPTDRATFVVVVHGPAWMLRSYAGQLARLCRMPVVLAEDGAPLRAGTIFIAPGDRHTVVDADFVLRVVDTPPENWVRPAADPLFRSAAAVFGREAVAVVMTGLGRDGTRGASAIVTAGGVVVVQDPDSCVAASMPENVIAAGIPCRVARIDRLASTIEAASGFSPVSLRS